MRYSLAMGAMTKHLPLCSGFRYGVGKYPAGFPIICLAIGLVCSGFSFPWLDDYMERRFAEEMTGTAFSFGKEVASFETERSWNGDGYSAFVYRLAPEDADRFKKPQQDFYSHPVVGSDREGWRATTWRKSPVSPDHKLYLDFALSMAPGNIRTLAETALAKTSSLYSCMHKTGPAPGGGQPRLLNVDFFIVDPADRMLFIFNLNT